MRPPSLSGISSLRRISSISIPEMMVTRSRTSHVSYCTGMDFGSGIGPRARLEDVEFVEADAAGEDAPIGFDFAVAAETDS